ncbi:hypothetical protein BC567DRAFT_225593 [Phyllosticta citribraziliensis]
MTPTKDPRTTPATAPGERLRPASFCAVAVGIAERVVEAEKAAVVERSPVEVTVLPPAVMVVVTLGTLVQRFPLTVVKGLGGVAIHAGSRCKQLEDSCGHGAQQGKRRPTRQRGGRGRGIIGGLGGSWGKHSTMEKGGKRSCSHGFRVPRRGATWL